MQNDKLFFDPNFKTQLAEAPKLEAIRREDLCLSNYRMEPGGPLGRRTIAVIHHPTLGDKPFATDLPMAEEAVLDFVALTTSASSYKALPGLGGGIHEVPQQKPEGLWVGDPAELAKAQLTERRSLEAAEAAKAAMAEKRAQEDET